MLISFPSFELILATDLSLQQLIAFVQLPINLGSRFLKWNTESCSLRCRRSGFSFCHLAFSNRTQQTVPTKHNPSCWANPSTNGKSNQGMLALRGREC